MASSKPSEIKSVIIDSDLESLTDYFEISSCFELLAPGEQQRVDAPPEGFSSVYLHCLEYGVPLSLTPFAQEVVNALQIAPSQLCPRAWRMLLAAERGWGSKRYPPISSQEFFHCIKAANGKGSLTGWVQFTHRAHRPKIVTEGESREKSWRERFLFFRCLAPLMIKHALLPWNERPLLNPELSFLNSRQRNRLAISDRLPFSFKPSFRRFCLPRRFRRRSHINRNSGASAPDRFWEDEELEYPTDPVLIWLFDRSINPNPVQAAIDHGLISRDDNGKVRILKPRWEGICERWQKIQDEGPVPSSPGSASSFEGDANVERDQPQVVGNGDLGDDNDLRYSFRFSEGAQLFPGVPLRAIPAPLQKTPAMLGPVHYGASLCESSGAPPIPGPLYWDRALQITGEIAQTTSLCADQWGVDDFLDSVTLEGGPPTPLNSYANALEELEDMQRQANTARLESDSLRQHLRQGQQLLRSLEGRRAACLDRVEEIEKERDSLMARRHLIPFPESPYGSFGRLIRKARARLYSMLGQEDADPILRVDHRPPYFT